MAFIEQSGRLRPILFLSTIGIFAAILLFFIRLRQERRRNEYEKYAVVQQKYMRFQELCIQYPHLDFGPWPPECYGPYPSGKRSELTDDEEYQQDQLFWILISIFEEAFLLRRSMNQWPGWEEYIAQYCQAPRFREIWFWEHEGEERDHTSNTFDKGFEAYLNMMLKRHKPPPAVRQPRDLTATFNN